MHDHSIPTRLSEYGLSLREVEADDRATTWDFWTSDGRAGYVRLDDRGLLHLTEFVSHKLSDDEAALIRSLPKSPIGRLEVLPDRDGGNVARLVSRFPVTDPNRLEHTLDDFGQIRSEMPTEPAGEDAFLDLTATLGGDGLAIPTMASKFVNLRTLGPWWWATSLIPTFWMYMHDPAVDYLLRSWDRRPLFALCHQGHGVNSYGLNLICSTGPIALACQVGWGGVYANVDQQRSQVAEMFRVADLLPRNADTAKRLVSFSQFRGVSQVFELDSQVGVSGVMTGPDRNEHLSLTDLAKYALDSI